VPIAEAADEVWVVVTGAVEEEKGVGRGLMRLTVVGVGAERGTGARGGCEQMDVPLVVTFLMPKGFFEYLRAKRGLTHTSPKHMSRRKRGLGR